MKYNGWTNYETWCCNLWLTDDEYTNDELTELACGNNELFPVDALKDLIQENMPLQLGDLYYDLLRSAIEAINFHEIIENHKHDLD